jgi:Flp pilus assembly protein TadD
VHLPINLPRKQFWLYVEINDDEGLEALSERTEIPGFKNLCEGQIAKIRNEHDLAEQYFQWATEQNPKLWEANIGIAANPNTPVSKARQHLMQAQKIAPQTARVHIALAEWLVQSNQLEEAAEIAKKLISSAAVFESTRSRAQNILNQL